MMVRVDVKKLRASMQMSQPEFALAFGFNLATLRAWEQGRFYPDGAARTLLTVIMRAPDVVKSAVNAVT